MAWNCCFPRREPALTRQASSVRSGVSTTRGLNINLPPEVQVVRNLYDIINDPRTPANRDAEHIFKWCKDDNINVTLDCNVSECERLIKYFSTLVDFDHNGDLDKKRQTFIVSALRVIFGQIEIAPSFKDKLIAVATRDSDDCSDRAIYGLVELLCLISNSKLESQIGTGDLSTYKFIKELEEKKTLDQFCRDLGNAHVRNIKQKGLSFKEDIEVNLFLWDLFKTELGLPVGVDICKYSAYALLGGEFLKNLIDTLAVSDISVDPSVIINNTKFNSLLNVSNVNARNSSNPSKSFLDFCANPTYRSKLKEMFNIIRTEDSKNQTTFIAAMEKRLEMLKFQDGTPLYKVYIEKKNDFLDNDYNLDTVGIYNLCQAIDDILMGDADPTVKESFIRVLLTTNDALYLSSFKDTLHSELSKLVVRNTPALKMDAYTRLMTIQDKEALLDECASLLLSPEVGLSDIEASALVSLLIGKIERELSFQEEKRKEETRIKLFQTNLEETLNNPGLPPGLGLVDEIESLIIHSTFESRRRLLAKCSKVLDIAVDILALKEDAAIIALFLNKLRSYVAETNAATKIQAAYKVHRARKEETRIKKFQKDLEEGLLASGLPLGLGLVDEIDRSIIQSRFSDRTRLLEKCAEVLGVNVDTLSSKKDSEVIDLFLNKLKSYAATKIQAAFRGHKTRKELKAVSALKKSILLNVDMSSLSCLGGDLLDDLNNQGTNISTSIYELLQRISSAISGDPVTEDTVIGRLKAFSVEKRKSKESKVNSSGLDSFSWPAWGPSVFCAGRAVFRAGQKVFGAMCEFNISTPEQSSQNTKLNQPQVSSRVSCVSGLIAFFNNPTATVPYSRPVKLACTNQLTTSFMGASFV